ncbi:MAG: SSS family solute/sodium (Na+) symporter [Rhodobacteraceae bacterium]|jgi:SSS family solute:Na+ symporter|uniref:Solute:Na+ symporter, SSS family n=1 Tax=Salipiger profundus TaxID=1229727 RepID=A0A1U7D649_9RHOB|nr:MULTISPECIES: sodium/solute symporter [Salipiger]APX23619.1 solute:Na+ symporter, SSS family [Salipiger profundus]MAB09189.1 SSS family solute/sodium (Na+) symporter [Paracoccaceae bacterium]GGA30563.1 sodium/glucose cotransporter 2 [Salipiger profundus]SFD97248.1 solute:Na+ symporter, SSS family [Salipiger profundus]
MQSVQGAITSLDLTVIAIYLVIVIAIGIWVSKQTKTGEDLFLGGRSLTWGAIGLSLFASNISTTTIIGLTGSAYATGIATSAFEWMSGIPLLLLAFIFAPLYLKSKVTTTPEWLDKRYSRRVRLYFSGLTVFFTVFVDTAGGLYAGGVVFTTFFPQVPLWAACIAIGLFAGGYAATGGLKAVVYTDVLQAIILLVGCSITAYLMFQSLDFSWARVQEALPEGHLDMVKPLDDPDLPWPGLFLGVWMLGFWYWVTNQYVVQRVLGARSVPDAQRGAILGGLLKCIPLFVMVLPGAMAVPLLPDLPEQDMVFPVMITQILPTGLTGLVLAGLVAAIMSTVDSTLNSSSTLVVHDFITKPEEPVEPETSRKYGMLCTALFMVVAVGIAPLIQYAGGIWQYLQQAFSIIVPPIVAVYFLGAIDRKASEKSAFFTMISMHLLGVVLFALGQVGIWPLHFTVTVSIMTIGACLLHAVLSRTVFPQTEAPGEDVIWDARAAFSSDRRANGGLLDVRLWGAVLAFAMAAILFVFW